MAQEEPKTDVDNILDMVDLTPGIQFDAPAAVIPEVPTQKHPFVVAFLECVDAWQAVLKSTGYDKVISVMKYTALFGTFTSRFQALFAKDEWGQYATLEHGRKFRPIDKDNHALFLRAVRYRFE